MIAKNYTIIQDRVPVPYSKQKFFYQIGVLLKRMNKLGLAAAYAIRK